MATITVPAQAISATEFVSPSVALPLGLQSAVIQMTSCPQWGTATGWFSWAIETSFDGGATWTPVASQGYVDPHQLAIGALDRHGNLPSLAVGWTPAVTTAGRVRARAKTDGAALTCAFAVTTSP